MIPESDYELIRNLDVDCHDTLCQFEYWEKEFDDNDYLLPKIEKIKHELSEIFNRTELVNFYKNPEIEIETKFIAAMIWGHEAADGGKRDARGPWKLSQMFRIPGDSQQAIRQVSIEDEKQIKNSYKLLNRKLTRCGPSFFTKHFYFLGKSIGKKDYPVIFDNRVANGITKLSLSNYECLEMVSVSIKSKPEAYIAFLNIVHTQSTIIGCEPDQIEYYLFTL